MRVLVVSGSSGGHIFPALALVDALKDSCADLLLVLPKRSKDNNIPVGFAQIKYIHAAALSFNLSGRNIAGACSFLLGAWEGMLIILKFRPDVVVGFGSLNTVALIFWAWLFRIKTIIHEQNVIPGRANRLLAKLADRVAVSFSQTNKYLNISAKKIAVTGNPLRKDLILIDRKQALDFFKFKEGKFNILITGGSQGSVKLNSVCFEAITAYPKKDGLQLIHISGTRDYPRLKSKYGSLDLSCGLFEFFPAMQYAYSVADLVICRSGAATISELQKFRIPAILIPYPFAYGHQEANARILADAGAALIIKDEELSVEKLSDKLNVFLADPEKLEAMRQAYAQFSVPDASCLLAKEVLSLN
ncbi:MAG: undecaprenyldiphospho-muramoylpentapeptide beta-N-acetylglucosaminyltransferase [Candidatus Omnitrophica bacterium]|nr:undecaprenyldiphospho-muramoylpentapeptide beta-N-acetylglucosaminyltransferase [Candidatus Omnitrophota bacterium]